MKNTDVSCIDTAYDIVGIAAIAKKIFISSIMLTVLYLLLSAASLTAFILYNSNMWIFIASLIGFSLFLFLLSGELKKIAKLSFRGYCGEIVKVSKKVNIEILAGRGIGFGYRRYQNGYRRDVIRLVIFIKSADKVRTKSLSHVSERHAAYYDELGEAINVFACRFPIKREIDKDKWLCPICGEFNFTPEIHCLKCGNKILKENR